MRLVQPVRCHAGFRNHMHLVRAHLEFDVDARWPHQRGVQRLVAVEFGNGDVILELAWDRLVHLVQNAECRITVRDGGHDDAKAVDVRHLGKAQVLEVHFLVNRIQRLFAPRQANFHADAIEGCVYLGLYLLHQIPPPVARLVDRLREGGVAPGVQMPKRKVLQLAVGLVQPQAVSNRRVDFKRFGGNAPPLAAGHVRQCAHVVRTVGQLDEDDPHIPRHRQQHLAKRLCLVFFPGVELELVQLGQSVHQLCHRGAEPVNQIGLGHAAVFHGVVEQGGHQGLCVQLPGGALRRHGNGVGDVRLTAVAQLPQVRFISEPIGLPYLFNAGCVQVAEVFRQRSKAGRCGVGCGGGRAGCRLGIARSGLRCRR